MALIPPQRFCTNSPETYDVADTDFLVDANGYRTALSRLGLSGRVERHDRNHIEKWFHTFKMRTDRFHTCWVGSRPVVREWWQQFRWYYNRWQAESSAELENASGGAKLDSA